MTCFRFFTSPEMSPQRLQRSGPGEDQDRDQLFLHLVDQTISLERIKLDISNLFCRLNVNSIAITHVKVLQYGVHSGSRDLLKFWEISDTISETVQERDI